ncbi:MAG: efflux transporter outer membrane subunit [Verrucomicrobiales bacterium]|nr:efflux transporter outer membrane subunit [Verrucomicrobiales bacterium]
MNFSTFPFKLFLLAATGGFAVAMTGCNVDPSELSSSTVNAGAKYKNGGSERPLLPAGDWWACFNDPVLTQLIRKLEADNPSLAVALARYDRARNELGLAQADRFPSVSGDVVWKRKRDSASGVFVPPEINYSEYRAALNLKYEIDLWGRVRQTVEAAQAEEKAAAADVAAARLSLQAELAKQYFQLRYADAEMEILKRGVSLREENLRLVRARVNGGEETGLGLARAQTEVDSTKAQEHELSRSRASLFNAIAALCGEVPGQLKIPAGGIKDPPRIPSGLPSQLLTRRPDIVAADRRMAATVAQIGATKASYLPRVNLAASGGLSSLDLGTFFDPSSLFGEIGPEVQVPLYQAGRSGLDIGRAYANSDEAVALYRETVLKAFREVEDALSAMRYLDKEIVSRRRASASSGEATRLSSQRYKGGLVSYLEVVDAENSSLNAKRSRIQAESARLVTSVQLIQALGGGWEVPIPEADLESQE